MSDHSVNQILEDLERLRRINPADFLTLLPQITRLEDLERVGYLMEKTSFDEELAEQFRQHSLRLGIDLQFADAYIATMICRVPAAANAAPVIRMIDFDQPVPQDGA